MIAVLRALLLRPLLRRPWRFLVTVAGVATGIASVVATVAASRAAVASLTEGVVEVAGRTRFEISRTGGVDEDLLTRLLPAMDDMVIVPVIEELALQPALGDAVRVLGLELPVDRLVRDLDVGDATAGETALETVLVRDGVLLPRSLADRLQLAPGDTFGLSVRSRPVQLTVAATFTPDRFASAWDRVVVMDVAAAQELFGRGRLVDRIEATPRRGVDDAAAETLLRSLVPAGTTVAPPDRRAAQTDRMVRALDFNLTALSGISLLVAAVLVGTTLATSVVRRRPVIALARSLGASRAQVGTAVLVEAALIGVIGGALGIAGGIVGARLALASVRATVAAVVQGAPSSPIRLDLPLAAGALAASVAIALLAALLPLRESVSTPPLQGLRGERPAFLAGGPRRRALAGGLLLLLAAAVLVRAPAVAGLPVAALLAALCLMAALLATSGVVVDVLARIAARPSARLTGNAPRLAAAALASGRRRAAWAAGAMGVAVALAVAVATMVSSFRTTVVDWSRQAMRSDVWVRPLAAATGVGVGRLDPEVVRIAVSLFGEAAVDPFYTAEATVRGAPVTLGAGAFDVIRHFGGVPFRDGRDSRVVFTETLAAHGVIVNEPLARRFRIREGDTVDLGVPGRTVRRRVIGVFYDYSHSQGMVVMDRRDFLALYPDDGPSEVAIFLPAGSDAAAARESLLRALGGRWLVEALLNRELRTEVIRIFDRTFAITTALQLVAAAVAVVAVLTVLFAIVNERRRDLALLRALGGSPGQVRAVVLSEAALLGLTGAAGGLVIGLAIGVVLVKVVNLQSFGWTLRFLPPAGAIAVTAAGVVAACVAAGLAPAAVAGRASPREELHGES